jgi:hypothetical protein
MKERIEKSLWALFLLTLPVTSFPFFPPAMGGEALVRPLALYPLVGLMPFFVLPKLLRKPLPRPFLPLLVFALVALASSLLSLLKGIDPVLGISADARVLRGLFTLAIGISIYLVGSVLPENLEDLRFTLRWIYAGGALALLWGTLQAGYIIHYSDSWFGLLARMQSYISTRRLLVDRISGLTYEPHWFAEQIILLLIPFSLTSVMMNSSVFPRKFPGRLRRLSVEMFILGWSIILLPFTFSRAGVLNLVLLISISMAFLAPQAARWLLARQPDLSIVRIMLLVVLVALILAVPIYLIGARNAFFARVWEYWQQENGSFSGYLVYLGFDARLAYSQAAYNTYLAYPVLGVGLGNYGFYFKDMLPYQPLYEIPEVLNMVTPEAGRDRLITSKNLYLRLMAETGIVGAIAFLAFIITLAGNALSMWLAPERDWKYWGAASLSGLVAFSLCAFTFDSFVIPNMWVVFGLITAATCIQNRTGIIPIPASMEGKAL